jgi:hypothetical protein
MTAPDPEPLAAWLVPVPRASQALDLKMHCGCTWNIVFPPTPLPLTGATVTMQVRESPHPVGRVFADMALTLDEDGRTLRGRLTGEQTGRILVREAFYFVRATAGTIVVIPYRGRVAVAPDVTR